VGQTAVPTIRAKVMQNTLSIDVFADANGFGVYPQTPNLRNHVEGIQEIFARIRPPAMVDPNPIWGIGMPVTIMEMAIAGMR
jgi:hypothetical protein